MNFYKNKKIVVTGGAGFLGQVVVWKLKERGAENIFVPRRKEYDLTDRDAVDRLYEEKRPDLVVHLAAEVGGIGANMKYPGKYFYDNLIMGVQLLEYARRYQVGKFVAIGTICAYPGSTPVPFKEDDLWIGYPEVTNAPYGLAKKMMLVQAQAYREQYGYNAIFLLPVNLYGPGDNFDPETSHVIPALIRRCVEARRNGDETVSVWGDGTATREFLYVDDAAEGILAATESYNGAGPVNLGSGMEISIKDLAEKIARFCGFDGGLEWDTDKPGGQPRRCLDVSRAKELFGFQARMDFDSGLKKTAAWFEENYF